MVLTVESVDQLTVLAEAVCKLQSAFFGKGTQVNIQNNIGGEAYGEFLGDAPGQQ